MLLQLSNRETFEDDVNPHALDVLDWHRQPTQRKLAIESVKG
jgi:hypothetical protein